MLLTSSDIDRLLGAHSSDEADRILTEMKMTNAIDQGLDTDTKILAALDQWVRSEVEHMVPPEKLPVFQILWIDGDEPLLAYLLKRMLKLTSAISVEPSPGITAYDPAQLRACVDGEHTDLPQHIGTLVHAVQHMTVPQPRAIDTMVSQWAADTKLHLARAAGSAAITLFVRHDIDIRNIRTALRMAAVNEEHRLSYLLKGGTIKPEQLLGTQTDIRAAIHRSELHYALNNAFGEHTDPNALERGFSHILAQDIETMWPMVLGAEPPFAFAATALSHIRLIRAILLGKHNGIQPQDIKKMLPPYIGSSKFSS